MRSTRKTRARDAEREHRKALSEEAQKRREEEFKVGPTYGKNEKYHFHVAQDVIDKKMHTHKRQGSKNIYKHIMHKYQGPQYLQVIDSTPLGLSVDISRRGKTLTVIVDLKERFKESVEEVEILQVKDKRSSPI
jgi:hypothetical protein